MGCCCSKSKMNTNKDDAGNTVYLKRPTFQKPLNNRASSPIVERIDNNVLFKAPKPREQQEFSMVNPDEVMFELHPY